MVPTAHSGHMHIERNWVHYDVFNSYATFKWTIGYQFLSFLGIVLVSFLKGKRFIAAWQFAVKLTSVEYFHHRFVNFRILEVFLTNWAFDLMTVNCFQLFDAINAKYLITAFTAGHLFGYQQTHGTLEVFYLGRVVRLVYLDSQGVNCPLPLQFRCFDCSFS